MTSPQRPVLSGPFLRAAVTNFLFFSNIAPFNLLPLYIKRLGGTETEIGLIMGVCNIAAIFCQPVLGAPCPGHGLACSSASNHHGDLLTAGFALSFHLPRR